MFEAAIFSYRDQLAQIGAKDGTALRCVYSTPPSCKESQLATLKTHWLAMAAALDSYSRDLAEIGFPKVAARAAATFIDALGDAKQAAEAAAGATTIQEHNELAATAQEAIGALDDPEYKLMEALDWIVGP